MSMLESCLQGGSDDPVGAGPTDVKEGSPQQGQVGDEAQPAGEFREPFFLCQGPSSTEGWLVKGIAFEA